MHIPFLDLKAQFRTIEDEVRLAIDSVLQSTDFINGDAVRRFEKSFQDLLGVGHCIGVGNGTDALVVAMKSLDIGPGDEVIVPANSFIASAEAVTVVGAKVVFVDVEETSFNLNAKLIEAKVSERTKAIIAVHLYGRMCDVSSLQQVAKKHSLFIIEDCAQAHLSEYHPEIGQTKIAGTIGDIAAFSFYPGKNLGAYGDAGAVVTKCPELAEKARRYANHGRIAKYDHDREGINTRLDTIQAAILEIKCRYIRTWTDKRRAVARKYDSLLRNSELLRKPEIVDEYNSSWHLYVVRTHNRNELSHFLKSRGIASGIHYPIALPFLGAYRRMNHSLTDFPVAGKLQDEIISLPMYPELEDDMIKYVCDNINDFVDTQANC